MASLSKRNGLLSVRFINHDGGRKTLALETRSQRQATASKLKLEDLVASVKHGRTPDPEVLDWISKQKPAVFRKLVQFGLVEDPKADHKEAAELTLGKFLENYVANRADVKASTRSAWEKARRNLLEHVGTDKPLLEITAGNAQKTAMFREASLIRWAVFDFRGVL